MRFPRIGSRLAGPAFDIDQYAREAVTIFGRATCVTGA